LPLPLSQHIQQTTHQFSTKPNSPETTFASFHPPLHPATLHALTNKLKFLHPTDIQTQSYDAAITRRDVLARARTGTGKTLAFLLPSIQNALTGVSSKRKVEILILCPTRELASQIHSTAQILAASHSNSSDGVRMNTQVMFGGVPREKDVQKLQEKLPFVLVATPGRLLDHMENTVVGGVRFGQILGGISVLVLDEVSSLNTDEFEF
jgi:superfamily II DNA/RNA helicase